MVGNKFTLMLLATGLLSSCAGLKSRHEINSQQERELNEFFVGKMQAEGNAKRVVHLREEKITIQEKPTQDEVSVKASKTRRVTIQESKIKHIRKPRSRKYSFIRRVHSKKVQRWMEFLGKKDKKRFQRFINNGEKYRPIIEKTFAKYGLPKELYFVGLIESGYYLGARSRASAVGPWQFMKATARVYNLTVNRFVDERRSIHKASEAAAKYYADLYNIFGSWELALAAYNKGENGIIRRIRKANTRDYYELCRRRLLPRETRNYIPKIIAAMNIYKNPKRWGLTIPQPENIYDNTTTVKVKGARTIKRLAMDLGLSVNILRKLNPDFIGYRTPNIRKAFSLRVPNKSYSRVKLAKLNMAPKSSPRVEAQRRSRRRIASRSAKSHRPLSYKVKRGDNLTEIADLFDVSIRSIIKRNKLGRKKIFVGEKLIIPNHKVVTYKVRRGDNLSNIADKFGLSLTKLKKVNKLKKSVIIPGQRLAIAQSLKESKS